MRKKTIPTLLLLLSLTAFGQAIFSKEPWYLSNPLSRVVFYTGSTFVNLFRFDRVGDKKESYSETLSNSASQAFGHTLGILGDVANDASRAIHRSSGYIQGYVSSEGVLQCTGLLPVGLELIDALSQMKHSWIQMGSASYGMPYTTSEGYFGGDALIRTPDPLVRMNRVSGIVCTPVLRPRDVDNETFTKRIQCVAEKMAAKNYVYGNPSPSQELVIVNYNAFTNNCVAAVRYIAECAGGLITQNPNLTVGSSVEWDDQLTIQYWDPEVRAEYSRITPAIRQLKDRVSAEYGLAKANPNILNSLKRDFESLLSRILAIHPGFEFKDTFETLLQTNLLTDSKSINFKLYPEWIGFFKFPKISLEAFLDKLPKDNLRIPFPHEITTYRKACEKILESCAREEN